MISEFDFAFCPRCGSKIVQQGENMLACTSCDLHYYINPKPSNAVILKNKESEMLLVKRKHEPQKDYWDLPGGFVDINETIEESVNREMREELGITVEDITYLTSLPDRYRFAGINYYTICSAFTAKIPENASITIGDDVADIKFVKIEEINVEEIAFKAIKELISSLKP